MAGLDTVSRARCFGGVQAVFSHESEATGTPMRFAVYTPPAASRGPVPVLWFLSGLTCTEQNFITKAGAQRAASELGLMLVVPDTSPRGAGVEGEDAGWDFGTGAGFWLDATQAPWSKHYRMASYLDELSALLFSRFPGDAHAQGIFGHSMGGHGALVHALRDPERFRSVSALSPICAPSQVPWGQKAFSGYLGEDRAAWRAWDAVGLLEDGRRCGPMLVDQGLADSFLERELKPELLEAAAAQAGQPLTLRRHEGYDHGYYFIATVVEDHLRHHAEQLRAPAR